jgi:hypothetical protein
MALSLQDLVSRSPKDALAVVRGKNQDFKNSGILSEDTLIKSGGGYVYWLTVSDMAALTVELNDSTDGSGTGRWGIDIPSDGYGHFIFDPPIKFLTGIYLDVSTGTCKVTVGYI